MGRDDETLDDRIVVSASFGYITAKTMMHVASPTAKTPIASNTTISSVHRDKKPKLDSWVSHSSRRCFVESAGLLGSLGTAVVAKNPLRGFSPARILLFK